MESQSQTDFLMQVTHGESLMCHHKERHELNCESITQKPRCSLWDTRDFSWEMDWTFGFIILNLKVKQDEKGKILSFIHITSMQVFKINLNYANDSLFLTKKYICGSSDHVLRVWYGHSWKITKLSTLNASLRLHDLCPHIECFLLVNHLHKNCVLSYAVWKPPRKKRQRHAAQCGLLNTNERSIKVIWHSVPRPNIIQASHIWLLGESSTVCPTSLFISSPKNKNKNDITKTNVQTDPA